MAELAGIGKELLGKINEIEDQLGLPRSHRAEDGGKMEWIPVSEKLPEPYTDVLVNITYEGNFEGIDIAAYNPDFGYIDDKWDTQIDWMEGPTEWYHVTAWMPLPKPYEKEESEETK